MATVHNPDQIMAWKPADVEALIGRQVTVWEDRGDGPWRALGSGLVTAADLAVRYAWESAGTLTFADGSSAMWLSGQPIYIEEG